MSTLRAESRRRFPGWSRHMRAKWVLARLRAARIPPHWCKLVPLSAPAAHADQQFAPRTLR